MSKIRKSNIDPSIVSDQTELNETISGGDFVLIYDTSAGVLKKVLATNIQLAEATITSVSPTNVNSKDSALTTTFTVTGTNFYVSTTAKLKNNSGSDISFDTVTRDSLTQLTCVLSNSKITDLGILDEPYDVVVNNGFNEVTLANQINVDQSPVFITAAGLLATVTESDVVSIPIQVGDPESAGGIIFEVVQGSLPAGLSLNASTGLISGTASEINGDTTSTFTIRASDLASNVSFREFSITVENINIETFTTSGTFSVPVGVSSVDVLVVAAGGKGGGWEGFHPDHNTMNNGGGGAGGLIYRPSFPVTPGGTVSITVGSTNGQNSVFGTLTAIGGGGGGAGHPIPAYRPGYPGGSGGGGGGPDGPAGNGVQPTEPGDSGTYGFGNPGNPAGGAGGGAGSSNGAGRSYTIADGSTPVFYAGGGSGIGVGSPGEGTGSSNKGGGGAAGMVTGGDDGAPGNEGIVIVNY